jgi:hypothetical protein
LEAVYVSNNITSYNINSASSYSAHNQNVFQNSTITDSFNSIIQEVDKSTYTNSDKEDMKTTLKEIKENIESKNIPKGISKLDKLRKYESIYQVALPWALKIADIVLKGQ